jgi:serine/threonine-protein kinase
VLEGVDDDGTWTAQLRGDGTLTLETFAYRCACLRQGRRVPDREFAVCGHDPWTGKRLRAGAAEGPTAQSLRDRLLNVHGEGCGRIESPGAEVWLFRDAEVDRVLVPSGEGAGGPGVPEVALPYLYPGSAVRPRGPGLFVGRTPIRDLKLPMSSGVLIVVATGRQPARVPFSVGRGEQVRISVTLFSPGETPDSACLVTPPSSRSGPLRSRVAPEAEAAVDGEYFVQRFPVTCGEYVEFLNALAAISPREALKRIPRAAESSDFYWQEDARGKVSVPGSGAEGKASEDDWRADWPVIGVSWGDAMAYARWKSERDGRLWCLPPESLWQRAAQGDDARPFPWGERRIAWFSHNLESAQGRQRPEPVGSRPFDESPFGVRDLAGNVSEWCLDEVAESAQPIRLARGGNWSASHLSVDCLTRLAGKEELVHPTIGFRICSPVAVTRAKAPVSGA